MRLDPTKGRSKTPEYLALNPRGKVPTLTNGEFIVRDPPPSGPTSRGKCPRPIDRKERPCRSLRSIARSDDASLKQTSSFDVRQPLMPEWVKDVINAGAN
jgi:hypothetical protein